MKKTALESSMADACETLSETCSAYSEQWEEQIRRAPLASVLCAGTLGYFLQFLPLGRIATGLIRIFVNLIQPAVMLFGAFKLVSWLVQGCEKQPGKVMKPKK